MFTNFRSALPHLIQNLDPDLQAFLSFKTAVLPPYWTSLRHAPVIYLEKGPLQHHPSSTHNPGTNMKQPSPAPVFHTSPTSLRAGTMDLRAWCHARILPFGSSWTVRTLNMWSLTLKSPVTSAEVIYLDSCRSTDLTFYVFNLLYPINVKCFSYSLQ